MKGVRAAVEAVGATLLYLPPYDRATVRPSRLNEKPRRLTAAANVASSNSNHVPRDGTTENSRRCLSLLIQKFSRNKSVTGAAKRRLQNRQNHDDVVDIEDSGMGVSSARSPVDFYLMSIYSNNQ